MSSSQCVTTTGTDVSGVKTITTTCTEHPDWLWAHWDWAVLVTVAVLAVGYVVAQWYDRREARARTAELVAAQAKTEAAYQEIKNRDFLKEAQDRYGVRRSGSLVTDPTADPT